MRTSGSTVSLMFVTASGGSRSTRTGLVHEMGLAIATGRCSIITRVLAAEESRAGLAIESVDRRIWRHAVRGFFAPLLHHAPQPFQHGGVRGHSCEIRELIGIVRGAV